MCREAACGAMAGGRAWTLVVATAASAAALAGCVGDPVASAMDLAPAARAHAEARVPGASWQGMAALDGAVDLAALQTALATDDADARAFLDAFDLTVANGEGGDGRAGSWFSFHYLEGRDGAPRASATLQVFADGRTPRALVEDLGRDRVLEAGSSDLAPRGGPDSGQDSRPDSGQGNGPIVPPATRLPHSFLMGLADDEAGRGRCTSDHEWRVDSPAALATARGVEAFRAHELAHPEAGYAYSYLPATLDDACDGNLWYIEHLEFGRVLEGRALAGVAVAVDAASGEVLDVEIVRDLVLQTLLDQAAHEVTGPVPPTFGVLGAAIERIPFTVPRNATDLVAQAAVASGGFLGGALRLTDPTGAVEADADGNIMEARISEPLAGSWQFEYVFDTVLPAESHTLQLRAAARVSR